MNSKACQTKNSNFIGIYSIGINFGGERANIDPCGMLSNASCIVVNWLKSI